MISEFFWVISCNRKGKWKEEAVAKVSCYNFHHQTFSFANFWHWQRSTELAPRVGAADRIVTAVSSWRQQPATLYKKHNKEHHCLEKLLNDCKLPPPNIWLSTRTRSNHDWQNLLWYIFFLNEGATKSSYEEILKRKDKLQVLGLHILNILLPHSKKQKLSQCCHWWYWIRMVQLMYSLAIPELHPNS